MSIRVTIDKTNEDDYPKIKNMLYKKYGNFFHVYYAFVRNTNSCVDKVEVIINTEYEKDYKEKLYKKYNIDNM